MTPQKYFNLRIGSALKWARKNLFNTWYNSLLTVGCLWIIYQLLKDFTIWITGQAKWEIIRENFRLFLVGRYPESEYWRLWLVLVALATLIGLSWVRKIRNQLPVIWILAFPIILWLIGGGLGLSKVDTNLWNGLLLTLLMAVTSIILSFPLGILLALGRTSQLPVVRWFSIIYIEVIRGLPLIGILFIAQVMLPLVLPPEIRLDRVLRASAGLTLFSAAYIAENVRGGLQAIPRSQIEAAKALGLNPPLVVLLIILPQALRIAIPSIVGQFIGLFKDTTLLSIVGLLELLGMARSILAQPEFMGSYAEVYLFVGALYWLCCYGMSLASRRLEENLAKRKPS
ncbi:MAG: amino acid ABC transporter permease [Oscillatoriaceae bacterium SKW80]|nr:amino acid ABC transporter permease [Oscillatoriaceae bacterium SKYG93]MCX8119222.1 amino acid ABC transporter permease [Oscillatoriaceae bacterium SKW80]MDW8454689.1 amino acid ABC transporter permease [Oscillatoriaceae cyanobacterium SKYGB_i_bin93]HIK28529.1 amino acid ABC transporter permease [Oscillatoriaceae cyanobacterium M7585_C2015_266]